ncbi:pirin family protein [Methylovirgula sp. 4M-Z18]|uniref:pirin family protein n=1 Tax=Methylovirgula sp. 4M-Z18 TaxID=2293567 RepID=UPI000E2ED00D|nr:pirin family protein [Methylovirgula sp. 4M-Z18]RFB78072.1 pirin family protein [Methylovirgula sp. 4M-Z18]
MTLSSNAAVEQVILPPVRDLGDGFKVRRALPSAMRRMVGPFIFFDQFGPIVFRVGEGQDVRPHPHIGLSTLTYLIDGEIVHRDSAGNMQAIRAGEANWMTAGSGIVHSERSSPEARRVPSALFGQQIWIALPTAVEEIAGHFSHHDAQSLPVLTGEGATLHLVAGMGFGAKSPVPVYSDLIYADVQLAAGARFQIPPEHIERGIYIVSGGVEIVGQDGVFGDTQLIIFRPGAEIILQAQGPTRFMMIGGEPLPEKRYIYWNFVSSSRERIEQAKDDWRNQRFPGIVGESEFIPLPADPPNVTWKD